MTTMNRTYVHEVSFVFLSYFYSNIILTHYLMHLQYLFVLLLTFVSIIYSPIEFAGKQREKSQAMVLPTAATHIR